MSQERPEGLVFSVVLVRHNFMSVSNGHESSADTSGATTTSGGTSARCEPETSGCGALDKAEALLGETWEPEAIALGSRAAYLWCPDGIIQSKLLKAFSRATGDAATTRNWATVLKLQQAVAYPRR